MKNQLQDPQGEILDHQEVQEEMRVHLAGPNEAVHLDLNEVVHPEAPDEVVHLADHPLVQREVAHPADHRLVQREADHLAVHRLVQREADHPVGLGEDPPEVLKVALQKAQKEVLQDE